MSTDSNTNPSADINEPEKRTIKMVVPHAGVNAMLTALGVGIFPDAADLDAIVITVDHSTLINEINE